MQRPSLIALVSLLVVLFALPAVASEEKAKSETKKPAIKYIGAKGCKMCHNTEKQGKQYPIWQASQHSKAYATLASEEAKAIAKKMGIEDPQKSDKCLKCHVTAYHASKDMLKPTYSAEEGVSCESCHGPGEKYKNLKIMKDRKLAMENGLIIPEEKTCKSCHNPDSPTHKEFKYEAAYKQIAHPVPKAEG
jgi:hypothetical protein